MPIPAASRQLLRHNETAAFSFHFDYLSIVEKLSYLKKSTRPDISFTLHQCARFGADPRSKHGKAIIWLGRYLAGNRDKGLTYQEQDLSVMLTLTSPEIGPLRGQWPPWIQCTPGPDMSLLTPIAPSSGNQSYRLRLLCQCQKQSTFSTALREVIPIRVQLQEKELNSYSSLQGIRRQ
jgi:hypothetical protein